MSKIDDKLGTLASSVSSALSKQVLDDDVLQDAVNSIPEPNSSAIEAISRGDPGPRGPQGPPGEQGPEGDRGPKPDHEWEGTSLKFEKPDGKWGDAVDLQGPQGAPGRSRAVAVAAPAPQPAFSYWPTGWN